MDWTIIGFLFFFADIFAKKGMPYYRSKAIILYSRRLIVKEVLKINSSASKRQEIAHLYRSTIFGVSEAIIQNNLSLRGLFWLRSKV